MTNTDFSPKTQETYGLPTENHSKDNCFIPEAIEGRDTPVAGILIFLHLEASAKARIASPETAAVIFCVFFSENSETPADVRVVISGISEDLIRIALPLSETIKISIGSLS